jgi:aminobenzoyl-glutamate utilization protein A
MIRPLANRLFTATFFGESAHAGAAPEEGRNAMQALGAAIQNVYGIARHSAGATRVNLGRVEGGTASNVVADHVRIEGEARAETTAVQKEMFDRVRTVLEHAAEMHDCEVDIEVTGDAPRADSDEALATLIQDVAQQTEDITSPITLSDFGASEDATYLMDVVESQGGKAAYSIIGTDHPTGHHTSHFDIDEKSLSIGVELMSESISKIASERP